MQKSDFFFFQRFKSNCNFARSGGRVVTGRVCYQRGQPVYILHYTSKWFAQSTHSAVGITSDRYNHKIVSEGHVAAAVLFPFLLHIQVHVYYGVESTRELAVYRYTCSVLFSVLVNVHCIV